MESTHVNGLLSAILPEFNPSSIEANKSYLVSTEIPIRSNVNFPENVTLYFIGGKLTGNGYTLKANNTKIIAGIAHIFDKNLEFDGSWMMDKAYPQWFGAKNTYNYDNPDPNLDATLAINKAINLKRVGEVFIPRGEYLIADTIFMKVGIILKGEKAYSCNDPDHPGVKAPQNDYKYQGTMLRSIKNGSISSYTKGYMILLNINPNFPDLTNNEITEWIIEWPEYHTAIMDIYFMNDKVKNLKGIYIHGGFNVEYCRWKNFAQAVGTTTHYADLKSINHCNFYNGIEHNKESVNNTTDYRYAFDLNQGDGLSFKNVHVGLDNSYIKGSLRINLCNGGEISHCILNDNVLIQNSKAIHFAANHLEGKKTQMTVLRSIINISNNFFEKGCFPSLRIDGDTSGEFTRSVVTLDNNFFGYYGDDKIGFYTDTNGKLKPYNKPYGNSNYDIMTNGYAVIKLNNSFRYWLLRSSINKVNPYGLRICQSKDQAYPSTPTQNYNPDIKDNLVGISKFNDYTHIHSISNEILPNNTVSFNNSLLVPQSLTIPWCGRFSNVGWRLATDDIPIYRVQVILDKVRKIIGNNILNPTIQNDPNNIRKNDSVMISIGGISENGFNCIIRMERTFKGSTMICDIPICGAIHMYDNGDDVNGYRWESGTLMTGYKPLQSINFTGKNIICRGTVLPTEGTWTDGDIIYNMGSGSNALWIRQNGSWVAK